LDNWTTDEYDWDKEIVLITGGAGGIGGQVVRLLSERGTKVVVLDVIPMTFEARKWRTGEEGQEEANWEQRRMFTIISVILRVRPH